MSAAHGSLSLAEGCEHLGVDMHELWVDVACLGGELGQLEVEAYVLEVLTPDDYSHNLIAQALNEQSISSGEDHPVGYRDA